jgi:hypothetical protein
VLEQLCSHTHGNDFSLLALNTGNAYRTGHAVKVLRGVTPAFKPVTESGPLGLAANQANKGQVV